MFSICSNCCIKRVSSFWKNNYIEYETNGDKNSNLSLDEYFNKIKPYLRDMIIDLQSSNTWKIQLNLIFSKDTEEEHVMYSMSNNIKFTSYNDANEVVNEVFESLRSRCQDNLETSMRGSDFIFDSVSFMYYKCHKVNFKRYGSYIDSLDWIKNKKATINPKHEDDKCFQYAATVALNYEETKCNPERVSNIKSFINKYNWEGINYPPKIDNWKTFEKNNLTIALDILYVKEKEILAGYISKRNQRKANNSFNDSKQKKEGLALPCSNKITCIMAWKNFKT